MKITKIEAYQTTIELERPFVITLGAINAIESVIIKVIDDQGNFGLGEAAPHNLILGETSATILAALDVMAPHLISMDPRGLSQISYIMDHLLLHHTAVKSAIDMALHDLIAKSWGEPIWRILGGTERKIKTDLTIGLQPLDETLSYIEDNLGKGFKVIKLKVGQDPEEDIERIKVVRELVGERVRLRIDVNQGWTRSQALKMLKELTRYNLELVEQPLPAFDIDGLAWLRRAVSTPIMADESVHTPKEALRVAQEGAADYINIKLMKSGGLWKARQIAETAEAAGVGCMIGSMVETDLAITAAVHFAAATPNVKFADLDLGFSLRPRAKLIKNGGARFESGYVIPPNAPGLGVLELNEELIRGPVRIYK